MVWTAELAEAISATEHFRIVTEPRLALFTFQYAPFGSDADMLTAGLLERINDDGRVYLTQTRHEGQFVIRVGCTPDFWVRLWRSAGPSMVRTFPTGQFPVAVPQHQQRARAGMENGFRSNQKIWRAPIRVSIGTFDCTRDDVMAIYDVAIELAATL